MDFREFKEKVKDYPLFGSDLLDMLSPSPQALRNQVNRWQKKGYIIALKRGTYALSPRERAVGLSAKLLANSLYSPSYISLESALSHYKLIPEKIAAITSVTTRKTKKFTNPVGAFIFRNLKKGLFFGFREEKDEYGFKYFIAEPEKALLDYLYLNLGKIRKIDKDYFEASLRLQNRDRLDRKKIARYIKSYKTKKLERLLKML